MERAMSTQTVDTRRAAAGKSEAAFRTISEVANELDVPQHVLRFWETKFSQIRPMKRGGGRRYYRPEDVALLRRIRGLLYDDGFTIKGVQKLLREGGVPLRGALEGEVNEGASSPAEVPSLVEGAIPIEHKSLEVELEGEGLLSSPSVSEGGESLSLVEEDEEAGEGAEEVPIDVAAPEDASPVEEIEEPSVDGEEEGVAKVSSEVLVQAAPEVLLDEAGKAVVREVIEELMAVRDLLQQVLPLSLSDA